MNLPAYMTRVGEWWRTSCGTLLQPTTAPLTKIMLLKMQPNGWQLKSVSTEGTETSFRFAVSSFTAHSLNAHFQNVCYKRACVVSALFHKRPSHLCMRSISRTILVGAVSCSCYARIIELTGVCDCICAHCSFLGITQGTTDDS